MNRAELENYIAENYPGEKDYPWTHYPNFVVFRHGKQKCFAIIMDIPKSKLGLPGDSFLEVVNLKCSPVIIGSLLQRIGIFPAYHMNKEHWVTVALDGSVPDDELKILVDMSFEATASKKKPTPLYSE